MDRMTMINDDELSIIYNSPNFINNYGKDNRLLLIEYFDSQKDYTLAAKQLLWCITYKRMPKQLNIPHLRKFYQDVYSPSEVEYQISLAIQKQMSNDHTANIPPYPTFDV